MHRNAPDANERQLDLRCTGRRTALRVGRREATARTRTRRSMIQCGSWLNERSWLCDGKTNRPPLVSLAAVAVLLQSIAFQGFPSIYRSKELIFRNRVLHGGRIDDCDVLNAMLLRVFAIRHAECVMNTFPNRVGGRVVRSPVVVSCPRVFRDISHLQM